MGNIRSLKRNVARHPERVWLAKENQTKKEKDAKSESKQEETAGEGESVDSGDRV